MYRFDNRFQNTSKESLCGNYDEINATVFDFLYSIEVCLSASCQFIIATIEELINQI